jgi:adenine deaminase
MREHINISNLKKIIDVAQGYEAADLILKNARIIDIFSCQILKTNVAIYKGFIVGIGNNYEKARQIIDLKSFYVCSSFMDAHIHIESSLLSPYAFAKTVIPHGTSTCVIDPHEIANVLGLRGIKFMLNNVKHLPMDVYCMLPSCVPATPFETAGARLKARELKTLINHPQVLGLAEVMNFPGVVSGQKEVLEKLIMAQSRIIDGHCPALKEKALCAYISAGITSEHEATTLEEAQEKLSKGMFVMIREGSTAKNLKDLKDIIKPETASRLMFVSDDKHPHDLLTQGHLDFIVNKAISLGIDPFTAIKMTSFNCAQYFGLERRGAVACGFKADLITFKNLKQLKVNMVFKDGTLVVREGELIKKIKPPTFSLIKMKAMKVDIHRIKPESFRVSARGKMMRVIEVVPYQIVTKSLVTRAKISNGLVQVDIENDILKIAVIERYSGRMRKSIAFVKGFNFKQGAIASSVAHDSHNLIGVATNDIDLAKAFQVLADCGGGLCCVRDGKILALLELPLGGLMSLEKADMVANKMEALVREAHILGSPLENPFMTLSFLSLPVIPHLKITDRGLFCVDKFEFVDLFIR